MNLLDSSLFAQVKYYRALSQDIQAYIAKHPHDWRQFQPDFNKTVEQISLDLLHFEKEYIKKNESKVYKFQKIFKKRYRHHFLFGDLTRWTYQKPYGYAGDFKIIDDIYQGVPRTAGFDGLWDTYYLQMNACRATRARKDDMRGIIQAFVEKHPNRRVRIMNVGSGPAREVKEFFEGDKEKLFSNVTFDLYDFDVNAINYARGLINKPGNVNFIQMNAVRLALKKDIKQEIPHEYDLIYSTGLFDYLDERVAVRLVGNLRRLLKKRGIQVIANFGSKYANSSAGLMEWVTEWFLIYRKEEEFKKIFLGAGFAHKDIEIKTQPNKVIIYCVAHQG